MIVCVLLVSNSRGCCLVAPGDQEGAAHIVEIFNDISGPNVQYSKFLTWNPLHPIFNSLRTPATVCETHATACDVEIRLDMPWIGVDLIFKDSIFSFLN